MSASETLSEGILVFIKVIVVLATLFGLGILVIVVLALLGILN